MISAEEIARIKENIFPKSRESIQNYYDFPWHQDAQRKPDTYKPQSSQAVVIDIFGFLKQSRHRDELIGDFFQVEANRWTITFERTDKALLNELTPTQLDALLESEGASIIIEGKFMESDAGACSQTGRGSTVAQCSGDYAPQRNPRNNLVSNCALTGKAIKYWDFIPKIYRYDRGRTYSPCPFKGSQYQWMRILCTANAMAVSTGKTVKSFVFYFQSEKCPLYRKIMRDHYIQRSTADLIDPSMLNFASYNDFVKHCLAYCSAHDYDETEDWQHLSDWLAAKEESL